MPTYYVDPAGDDSDPGTELEPWETVGHAATTAVAGDTVIFEDGTYNIAATPTFNTGTPGNIIAFRARNRRLALWQTASTDRCIDLQLAESHLTFSELKIRGTGLGSSSMVNLEGSTDVIIDDCEIYNTMHRIIRMMDADAILIEDCTLHHDYIPANVLDGIELSSVVGTTNTNIVIRGNEIYHTSHGGIRIHEGNGVLIENNYIHDTGSHSIGTGVGVDAPRFAVNVVIRDNTLETAGSYDPGNSDHNGFHIHEGTTSLDIYRNTISGNQGGGIAIHHCAATINIWNNTFYNNLLTDWTYPYPAELFLNDLQSGDPAITFKNNLVFHIGDATQDRTFNCEFEPTVLDSDYNLFYTTQVEEMRRDSVTYNAYSTYMAAHEPNSISVAPLMTDPGSGDFTLLLGSPCINAGVDVGLPYSGSAPDIGALETSPVPAPIPPHSFSGSHTQHQVIIRDTTGAKIGEPTDFLSLVYSKRVNRSGFFAITFAGDHAVAGDINDKYLIEIKRSVPGWGIDWYTDFYGVYRDPEAFSASGIDFFTMRGHDQFGILGWRRVAFYAGESGKSSFTSAAAEDIAKALVLYNATASATTGNDRLRNGPITNFTITNEAGSGGGDTIASLGVAYKNLITALSRVTGKQGGGDVDLIYTGSPGSPSWEFKWYTGQRGTDRTADVLFAMNYGNMENPYYAISRQHEKTVAIVGGQGKNSNRDIVIRTGTNYAAANDIETFVAATDVSKGNTTALNAAGDRALVDLEEIDAFDFTPKETEGYAYGKAYCVDGDIGDLVSARYDHPGFGVIDGTFKIVGVDVSVDNRGDSPIEQIRLIIEAWA